MPADYAIFAPRCICVLSNVLFYRAMTRYLRQLYSISISMTPVPIEKFVASVISQVPIPLPGGRAFEIFLDWGLVDHTKGEVPKLPPTLLQLSDRRCVRVCVRVGVCFAIPRCVVLCWLTCFFCSVVSNAQLLPQH